MLGENSAIQDRVFVEQCCLTVGLLVAPVDVLPSLRAVVRELVGRDAHDVAVLVVQVLEVVGNPTFGVADDVGEPGGSPVPWSWVVTERMQVEVVKALATEGDDLQDRLEDDSFSLRYEMKGVEDSPV